MGHSGGPPRTIRDAIDGPALGLVAADDADAPAEGEAALTETLARAKRYSEAGADSIFVPFVRAADTIGTLAREIALPLNVLAVKDVPDVAALQRLGGRRLRPGAGPCRAAYGAAMKAARRLLEAGQYDVMLEAAADCPNFNALFGE